MHKRSRTLREMVTTSGYNPRAVFELLLNTAQFELKLKEVCLIPKTFNMVFALKSNMCDSIMYQSN